MRIAEIVLSWCVLSAICLAQDRADTATSPAVKYLDGNGVRLASPPPEPDRQVLPINLASALQLSNVRPIDVEVAAERVRTAAAALGLARAAWLPTMTIGGDYNRHDGPIQDSPGEVFPTNRSSAMFGVGTGIGAASTLSLTDAIFGPLAARQTLRAREADVQTAVNDSMLAVTDAYFSVEQARGELAGSIDVTQRAEELLQRVRKLAPGIVPALEVTRAETEVARRQEAELLAQERWQVASADLTRILRLAPTAQVEPLEPPHLQVTLIDLQKPVDDLVVVGLTFRPELASYQAQVQASLMLLRQEKLRPLIPSILLRGWSTPASGTLAAGVFGGGTDGFIGNTGFREDFDLQVLWQLDNLGFGNAARARLRKSEYRLATWELFRIQDRVAAEVAQAYSQARQAARRASIAEQEVKLARDSYDKNVIGLSQVRRAGEIVQTVVRPQEAVAAIQALAQAYVNFYVAVAESNRAQFRLYRALGYPAQCLEAGTDCPPACETPGPELPPANTAVGN